MIVHVINKAIWNRIASLRDEPFLGYFIFSTITLFLTMDLIHVVAQLTFAIFFCVRIAVRNVLWLSIKINLTVRGLAQ